MIPQLSSHDTTDCSVSQAASTASVSVPDPRSFILLVHKASQQQLSSSNHRWHLCLRVQTRIQIRCVSANKLQPRCFKIGIILSHSSKQEAWGFSFIYFLIIIIISFNPWMGVMQTFIHISLSVQSLPFGGRPPCAGILMLCTSSHCHQVDDTVPGRGKCCWWGVAGCWPLLVLKLLWQSQWPWANCGKVSLHSSALVLHRLQFMQEFGPGQGDAKTVLWIESNI